MTTNVKFPKSWKMYRKMLAALHREADAPNSLVYEAGDLDYEGGGVFAAMHDHWREIEMLLAAGNEESAREDGWLGGIHDAVLNMCDEFNNPMNYGPGEKNKRINGLSLAVRVEQLASGVSTNKIPPYKKSSDEKFDEAGMKQDLASNLRALGGKLKDGSSDQHGNSSLTIVGTTRETKLPALLAKIAMFLKKTGVNDVKFAVVDSFEDEFYPGKTIELAADDKDNYAVVTLTHDKRNNVITAYVDADKKR